MQKALVRLVVLAIVLLNQALIVFGWNPLPFSEDQIFEAVSSVGAVAVGLWAWWKNNSVSKEAQQADRYLTALKEDK